MRVHVLQPLPGIGLAPWFEPAENGTFVRMLAPGVLNPFYGSAQLGISDCDAVLLPNNIRAELTPEQQEQLRTYADAAGEAGKPLFLFSCGDFTDRLIFDPRAYVFRYSVYRSYIRPQDIVVPTITRDQGAEGYVVRNKEPIPTVSFCGQAGYKTVRQWCGYYVKTAFQLIRGVSAPEGSARAVGVYWRRIMLRACRRSSLVRTRFIIRHSFSGALRTIELDPKQAHAEFVSSIIESDFVLAPKGDGNYSNRFLEALSLGRFPIFLDTDAVLPLEDRIPYERVMVRVPMRGVNRTPHYVREWYDAVSSGEWTLRQEEARQVFENALRFDSFFITFFTSVLPTLPSDPRGRAARNR